MWIDCSNCGPKPLWAFPKHSSYKNRFGCSYKCKECNLAYKQSYRDRNSTRPKTRQYQSTPVKKRTGWKDRDILEFMGFRLSDMINTGHSGYKNLTIQLDEDDYIKMDKLMEQVGYIPYSEIGRVALRYLFYTLNI
jgi:hypothetical protein